MVMRSNLADLPDVQYTYARAGVDVRVGLPASFSLLLGAGYRYVFSAGSDNYLIQAKAYFPDSSFLAFDVTAGAGFRFVSFLEGRVGFDLRRYQMSAGTNNYMVTGAADQYVALWGAIAIMLDGYAGGAGDKGGNGGSSPKPAAHTDGDDAE
jgi:hypothetical protein